MSDEQVSTLADGPEVDGGAVDALSDPGKRALSALRDEIRTLKAENKALSEKLNPRDAENAETDTSEGASDSAPDADGGDVATAAEPVKPRFAGTVDMGARKASSHMGQVTADDLRSMSPREIENARRNGRLRDLLSGNL